MTELSLQRDTLELIQKTAQKADGAKDKVTILCSYSHANRANEF